MTTKPIVVLALYPNKRGFGFVCLDWPKKIIDFGIPHVRLICNGGLLKQFVDALEFYKPEIVLIRDCENFSKAERSTKLIEKITECAAEMKLPIYKYSRQQIRDVFENFQARSNYEIAQKLIEWYPVLASRKLKFRKPWMDEHYNMPIFNALSLVVTHKYLTE